MNLYLHFILVNSEFNQGLADDLYKGEETEDNIKHLWEDELKVSEPIDDFKVRNNAVYTLEGFFPDETKFSYEIPEVTICDCTTEKGQRMQFAVSKKLIKKTQKIIEGNDTHMYFYLRDTLPLENPMNGVYILKKDFPKELASAKNTDNEDAEEDDFSDEEE